MARIHLAACLLTLLGAMTGCVTSDTLIKLNPDGSGVVVQKTLMSTEMISQLTAMMQGMTQQMAGSQIGQKEMKMPELFSDKDARAKASKMGEGVSYISSRKIKTGGMEGQEATYAFSDVTKLKLSEKPEAPSMPGMQEGSVKSSETTFRFSKLPNGHSLLTAVFSPRSSRKGASQDSPKLPFTENKTPAPEQMEQIKKLFAGFKIGMAIDVQGSLVKTNSLYQEGTRVTLLEMDFSELLSNEALLQQAAMMKGQTLDDAKELLKGLKGFKINLDPEVNIEFSK